MNSNANTRVIAGVKGVLVFFLRFIAASIVLYLLYVWLGRYYVKLVVYMAKPLIDATFDLDPRGVVERAMKVTEEISLNPVVFLSLAIATTGVNLRTRIRAMAVGVAILTVANALTIYLLFLSAGTKSELLWTGTEFFNLTMNFFMPLLLWFVLLPIRDLVLSRARGGDDS
jgi:hypothetical protein